MKILIKSAEILDRSSPHHHQKKNVLIENGVITAIGDDHQEADKIIEADGALLSVGWFDMRASFCDPGLEHKEDLISGMQAASAGGFTGVAVLPNTEPIIQTKNEIEYVKSKNGQSATDLYPIGAVTRNTKGEEITEMIDLHTAGAVAFSDGIEPIWHPDVLLKALQYLQKFDGLLITRPVDKLLNNYGVMHEGINSTLLGMRGMPSLSEDLMVSRDLKLLEYAGGRIHFTNISSAASLELIRQAKQRGLNVTCDIAAYQLSFDDDALHDFDTNYKVDPPFRDESTNQALMQGLKDGTIDVIVSSHNPQDEENKKLEFDLAEFGIISLQTVGANLAALAANVELDQLVEKVTVKPREMLGLDLPKIAEHEMANLTLFDPNKAWQFDHESSFSKSRNSPFYGQKLKGQVLGVFNQQRYYLNESV
ncbi:MAG: dihydroorotase [Bacteroidota bacterium]